MLSPNQLKIQDLIFLINANLPGRVPWEAYSSMKGNMQEAYLGSTLQKEREGRRKEGRDWAEGEDGCCTVTTNAPVDLGKSCRVYLVQSANQGIQGGPGRELDFAAEAPHRDLPQPRAVWQLYSQHLSNRPFLPARDLGRAPQHPLQLLLFYSNVTGLY